MSAMNKRPAHRLEIQKPPLIVESRLDSFNFFLQRHG